MSAVPAREKRRPAKDPTDYLNFRIDILSSEGMKVADEIYRQEVGLDVRHVRVLRLVGYRPGITFSELAGETRLERALTSRIVTALTDRGLVERRVSPTDARRFHLHLTTTGQAVHDQAGTLGDHMEELLLTPLSGEERAVLFRCLQKLTAWARQGSGLEILAKPDSHGDAATITVLSDPPSRLDTRRRIRRRADDS